MDMFLYIIGVFAVVVGVVIFLNARTSIDDVEGLISIGFGSVVFGLGCVVGAVRDLSSRLRLVGSPSSLRSATASITSAGMLGAARR